MRKGYEYLLISFISVTIASFFTKIGAISLDIILFIFISYVLGSSIAFSRYIPTKEKINKQIKRKSMKIGIVIGIVNFLSFFTLMKALSSGPGAIIYPLVGLNLATIVILSMILFRERLNRNGILGFILAIIAIWLLR